MIETLITYLITVTLLFSTYELKPFSLKTITKTTAYMLIGVITLYLYIQNLIDIVSLILGLSFTLISIFISLFTIKYIELHEYPGRLEVIMDLFLVSIITAYISPNFLLLVISWTIAELLGYILVKLGEEHSTEGSLTSSRGFIFTSTMTYELSVFTMITLSIIFTTLNIGISQLIKPFSTINTLIEVSPYLIPLLILGFFVKTANIPMHFWLPSAHSSAPAPASATLSGLMVSLGYYGLYRLLGYIDIGVYSTHLAWFFLVTGFFSILYGGMQARRQRDSKLILAYSTIATNGFISILFALHLVNPSTITMWTLILGIIMHSAYKTTLFCETGIVEAVYGTRYIHGIRGFINASPISTIGGILALFTLLGVPGTIGFIVKIASVFISINQYSANPMFSIASLIGILLYIITSALIAIKYSHLYFGEPLAKIEPLISRVDWRTQLPIAGLGALNILFCLAIIGVNLAELGSILLLITPVSILTLYITYMHFRTISKRLMHK